MREKTNLGPRAKAIQFCWVSCRWPLCMSRLPGEGPALHLSQHCQQVGKGRREEGWAVVVCLPIAQSSWVMTQPAASGPAKYISSAGLDHTVSP